MSADDDPVMAALAGVDAGGEVPTDPGAGMPEAGESPDARPEGPAPGGDDLDELTDDESEGFSVLSWASRTPEGSHLDFSPREWWDPETGAETRLAFHLSDLSESDSVGYPNGVGVLVGLIELWYREVVHGGGLPDRGDDGGDDEPEGDDLGETLSREEADRYV